MAHELKFSIGAEQFTFDAAKVNGLDAWSFAGATGTDLDSAVLSLAEMFERGTAPPLHLVVVAKWLAIRQNVDPLVDFVRVAATTTLPIGPAEDGD